ncbi:hypothetical protein EF294_20395 [Gordonia oryzae]|uniref:YCII-related domain-containing protein n=1 Tax=Gordonia oryzae TaxID=2487349 RepID=A0A3N4GCZ0_9ACTN|nr:YciI family protein [Gordonia oryzae]RPA56841.1 hypothetical protein EF294_20395 [Gordonia oryzae]
MFVIILRFSDNKSAAADHLPAHQAWVQRGVAEGIFVLVGSIRPGLGGALVAAGGTREQIQARVAQDPFVIHGVVAAEIIDIEPNTTDPRLAFLAQ